MLEPEIAALHDGAVDTFSALAATHNPTDKRSCLAPYSDCGGIGMDVEMISFAFLMIAIGAFVIW